MGIINTTSTSAYLNISNCAVFNVSITVYTDHYASLEDNEIYFNSGSKYTSYNDILEIHFLDYTVDIVEHTVTFDQMTAAVNIKLTNLVHKNILTAL